MSERGIYLLREAGELLELRPERYESEQILQRLIAQFPALLAGEEPGVPRRWLPVASEAGLPDAEDGASRWAVDHLFLDQDAVPTVVEVKLARDTRIRREVVGQMLDYAANAVVYWPIERLRERFLRDCAEAGQDPERLVAEVAGPGLEGEAFWERAQENLRAGKLRLLFVCDRIPRELQRVIEFLNGQMSAEVLGIELQQYVAEGLTTLVPRLVGQTAEAEARKRRSPRQTRAWDEHSFFAALAERRPGAELALARALYDWAGERGWSQAFGAGAVEGSWLPSFRANEREHAPLALTTSGSLLMRFGQLAVNPPFDEAETRLRLLELVNSIPGVSLGREAIDRYPSIPLATLTAHPEALERLEQALDWLEQAAAGSST
jgi:hypothetical protein